MRNANGSGHEQRRQTDGPGKDEVNRMNDFRKTAQEMLEFIRISPTCFHAVANIGRMLEAAGFQQLQEKEEWKLEKGGRYYTERNDSSVIAFVIPEKEVGIRGFHMAAAHSDSPCFKIKEKPELTVEEHYLRLNTEKYGGMILSTWLDRPLSVAGRLAVKNGNGIEGRLVNIDRDLCVIPNVAIHMNREMNKGVEYNPQVDLLPLLADVSFDEYDAHTTYDAQTASENAEEQPEAVEKPTLAALAAETAGVDAETILGEDLFLYTRQEGKMIGAKGEFVLSPRLDDLQCAFTSMKGFLAAENEQNINVYACFDNEEVGSGTKQGAASTFLYDVLWRMNKALGKNEEEFYRAVAGSFMLSCDNAHAVHPNYRQKTDVTNCVYMNDGIVIKSHAGQKYTSDAVSVAVFRMICEKAGIPLQYFANRSDEAGGSTLGNIAMTQVSMNTVDIGLPQLAMHSAYETAGVKDTEYMVKAVETFYASHIQADSDGNYQINQ